MRISDWSSDVCSSDLHGVAADTKEAALLAFSAGVDVDLVSGLYVRHLPELVAEGRVAESEIDISCARVLRAKQRLGLFQQPYRGLQEQRQGKIGRASCRERVCKYV